ncbi:hypothetical protein AQS8620_00504 [Aquimixticola soesokkakensis]|uniref:Hedgehog/Intein (Hint) domain-containing protein n=1 Tax=Aquimixticola soesokkakensis TaxID=1519096 RepID=A0A1Y5RMX4_9RHOB|nr:Hint domain-containing protein [Aquimixticola soesokkakensis]SLN20101.1 hypothetical protein AQS8620_00504 [Aquimixticola soesokkakensis]
METGSSGTFVIAWSQVELEGFVDASLSAVTIGASLRWRGAAICVDKKTDILVLSGAQETVALRGRAANSVHRINGRPFDGPSSGGSQEVQTHLMEDGFDVTDGVAQYSFFVIDRPDGDPLLMCHGAMPPVGAELWVVRSYLVPRARLLPEGQGFGQVSERATVCFTAGTQIETAQGSCAVEALRVGDLVQTADNGLQPVRWIGARKLSGARLFAMPWVRPVRLRQGALAGAFGNGGPQRDLLVSPDHRMVLRGAPARALFNESEVFVRAGDLVDGDRIQVDQSLTALTYVHLMFDAHAVVMANGCATESFHPEGADLRHLSQSARAALFDRFPQIAQDSWRYGPLARRALAPAEAALLRYGYVR